jgi:NADPH:quinone reductase-like Zn-dependent oxidoreductase
MSRGRIGSGLRRPKRRILGHELAGEVEAVGAAVTEFEVGDKVFGALPYLALSTGAHAEYMCEQHRSTASESSCTAPPARWGQQEFSSRSTSAPAWPPCATPRNVEIVRSLGADDVIDYTRQDFTRNGETYDVIFDAVGKHSFRRCKRSLKPGGVYLPTDGLRYVALWLLHKRFGNKKVMLELPPRMRKQDVLLLKELIEAGEYRARHRPRLSTRGLKRPATWRGVPMREDTERNKAVVSRFV